LFAVIEQAQAIKDLRDLDVRPKGLVGVIFGSADYDMGISDKELDAANSLINGNQPDGKSSINSVEGVMTGPPFVKYAQAVVKKHANTAPKTN
jgi:hypothetical protein